jgi:hypothetical protein
VKVGDNGGHSVKQEILDQWYGLVLKYTYRDLSFPGDKLAAIGAIAEHIGAALQDRYLGGLWKSHLPHNLSWHVSWKRYPRPKELRALSWSWAAIDGMVYGSFIYIPTMLSRVG